MIMDNSSEKTDFFLLSAHELRTSLSAMKWLFKMLVDDDYGTLNDEQRAAITQAMQANERMIGQLNDTIAAIKHDDVSKYTIAPFSFSEFIGAIVKEFLNEAAGKHITLTYRNPADPITINGDENKLRMALHNIIENAIKYSNRDTDIVITLAAQDNTAVLTIQDHGVGIPTDKQPHIFEKFFRAENTAETGTGLGLYSTRHIIEHHKGTITIASQEGRGTIVTVTLPLSAELAQ